MFKTKITKIDHVGTKYFQLELEKPDGYEFTSGQHLKLFFPEEPQKPNYYSIASAPGEGPLKLCVLVANAASKVRFQLAHKNQVELEIDAAGGSFTCGDGLKGPTLFIGGGSGIAPLRSMIYDQIAQSQCDIRLILGCSDAIHIPYREDFSVLRRLHPNFRYDVCADEGMVEGVYSGNVLKFLISQNWDLSAYDKFYMCGPPPMISACEKFLKDKAVSVDRIIYEKY